MRTRRWWQALLALVAIAAGLWFWRGRREAEAQPRRGVPARGVRREAGGPGERAVPVLVASVIQRDMPIYLEGLGTVVGYYTVTVRPQVAGRLDRVLFEEGQSVLRGTPIAQIDPRPFAIQLHQAEATLARDEAILAANRRTLERNRILRERNFVSPQDLDTARAAAEQYEGIVRFDRAQIESARLNLDYAHVRSPIDGVTGIRLVDPGNLVSANDTTGLVVITQIDPIAVLFTLPQDDLATVQSRMLDGALRVDVFSRDGRDPLGSGTLALIDNQISATTATMRLKAIFPNHERRLWPQQFVKVRLLLETRTGALVIPAAAVQRGPQGTFVYVVGGDSRVTVRPVEIDRIEGDEAIASRGVSAGERVITDGQTRLHPGALVAPRPNEAPPMEPQARGEGRARAHDPARHPPDASTASTDASAGVQP